MNAQIESSINTIAKELSILRAEIRKLGMAGTEPEIGHEELDEHMRRFYKQRRDPDLPLNVRVAKALGNKIVHTAGTEFIDGGNSFETISAYDQHVDLAMGALEEYCRKINSWYDIHYFQGSRVFGILIGIPQDIEKALNWMKKDANDSLPEAICEAIAKHAEQSK